MGGVDEVAEDGDVGAGEGAFFVEVGDPGVVSFDEGAMQPLVDEDLVAGGGALGLSEFDLHFSLA